MLIAAEELLGHKAHKEIREIPISNDTIKTSVQKMSNEGQIVDKIKSSPQIVQCDESTDVSQYCQLYLFDF